MEHVSVIKTVLNKMKFKKKKVNNVNLCIFKSHNEEITCHTIKFKRTTTSIQYCLS